tara:strand:+ start:811 stop:1038 length:228 start_codon:yes stop_codon:yes gene_type:complete
MLLHSNLRPTVTFNSDDAQHRKWFSDFYVLGKWGDCPVRFKVPGETSSNLTAIMQRQVLTFYLSKEFRTAGVEND